jgi:hypothetical protein
VRQHTAKNFELPYLLIIGAETPLDQGREEMVVFRKILIAAVAFAPLGSVIAISAPASAAPAMRGGVISSVPNDWYGYAPNPYEASDGYGSLADFSRSIEGTPCGMNCTRDKMIPHGLVR